MNRRGLLKTLAALPAVPALATPALALVDDDTDLIAEALATQGTTVLEPRVHTVRPGVLRITAAGKRLVGPVKAGVNGGAVLAASGPGTVLSIEAHDAIIENIGLRGDGGTLVECRRRAPSFGDLDSQFVGCTFTGAEIGVRVVGRGAFFDRCWFGNNGTHVVLDFPTEGLAPPAEHWQTPAGGARKYVVSGCYFHHGSTASVAIESALIHGVQITGCHHDAEQPLVRGPLVGATVTGNQVYRLRGYGLVLTGASRDSVITGNNFAGDRGVSAFERNIMSAAVLVQGTAANMAVSGNVRSCGRGALVLVAGKLANSVVSGNAPGGGVAVKAVSGGMVQRVTR